MLDFKWKPVRRFFFEGTIEMKLEIKSRRARETRHLIFTAASQIVLKDGVDRLNTNYIAERAGISIGTLYNYYDDKDGIIADMLEQVIENRVSRIRDAISFMMVFQGPEDIVEKIVGAFFQPGSEADTRLEQLLMPFIPGQEAYRAKRFKRVEEVLKPLIKALIIHKCPEAIGRDLDTICFVLIQGVANIIIASYLPEAQHLRREVLMTELTFFISGYLTYMGVDNKVKVVA